MALLERKTIEIGRSKKDTLLVDVDPKDDFVTFRFGEERVPVKKVDLWAVCFTIADEETQSKLVPVRETEMATYVRTHNVKLKKDLRAGEILRFHCEINVPQVIHETLAGKLIERQEGKSGGILIPRP